MQTAAELVLRADSPFNFCVIDEVDSILIPNQRPPPSPSRLSLQSAAELVLRADSPFNFCVIDEVDSILIDEARTPLIISGPSDKPSTKYYKVCGQKV